MPSQMKNASNNTKAVADKEPTSVLGLELEDEASKVDFNWSIGELIDSDPYINMELGIWWGKYGVLVHARVNKRMLDIDGNPIFIPEKT